MMAKRPASHFGLIGTDLFLNCFGAVFMMTVIAPHRTSGSSGSDMGVLFVFDRAGRGGTIACQPKDWGGITFALQDGHETFTAFDISSGHPKVDPSDKECQLSGILAGVASKTPNSLCFLDPDGFLIGKPSLYIGATRLQIEKRCE